MQRKKVIAAGLVLAVIFSLTACSKASTGTSAASASSGGGLKVNYSKTDYSASSPIVTSGTLSTVQMGPATKTPVALPYSGVLPVDEGPIGGGSGKTYTVGLSLPFTTNIWFSGLQDSLILEASRHSNIKVLTLNANQDAVQQANDVRNLISRKVDAIIIDPVQEAALIPAFQLAVKAGIPVIDVDRQISNPIYTNVVTGDFNQGPTDIAKWIVKQLQAKYGSPKGIIAEIQTDLGSTPQIARFNSFKNVVDKYNGIKVVGLQAANADETKAYTVMNDIMSSNPKIDVVYAHSEAMLMGAWKAMNAAGRTKDVFFIGCDLSKEGVQWIQQGKIQALAPWTPFIGDVALRAAIYDLEGKSVPKTVWLPSQDVVTQSNVKLYGGIAYGPVPKGMEAFWTVGKLPGGNS